MNLGFLHIDDLWVFGVNVIELGFSSKTEKSVVFGSTISVPSFKDLEKILKHVLMF